MGVALVTSALAAACTEDDVASTPGAGGSSGAGGPPAGEVTCGAHCAADLTAARAALEAGDYAGAFAQYRCADSREAAFGAGLTRVLTLLEGPAASQLMAHLGLAPLVATDLLGPDSIVSRLNRRWDGEGTLAVSGALAATLPFERAQLEVGEWPHLEAVDWTSDAEADLYVEFAEPAALAAGSSFAITFDCAATSPSRQMDAGLSYLELDFAAAGEDHWCSVPYGFYSGPCEPDGGRVVLVEGGSVPGQRASLTLENVLLECSREGVNAYPLPLVRVSGTVDAGIVSDAVDTAGLHPIFQEDFDFQATLPAATTVTELLVDAAGLAPELEEAACFFRAAGGISGPVFTFPGSLFAGADFTVSGGDSEVVGALLLATAAAAHLASAADVPLTIRDLTCDADEAGCPSTAALVEQFNAGFATRFRPAEFAEAARLLGEALPLLDAGLGRLDAASLLVQNATSSAGLVLIRDVVVAANRSLTTGATAIPHVTPAVTVDLRSFFATARNPRDVGLPVLTYSEQCDEWEYCWSETELSTDFLQAYTAGSSDVSWEGDYTWSDEDAVTTALDEILTHVGRELVGGG